MNKILKNIISGFEPNVMGVIDNRISEFKNLGAQDNAAWFSELCFCLLTANSQARKAIAIQNQLGAEGFLTKPQEEIVAVIRSHNHRFHNNKAKYIIEARKHSNIKDLLSGMSGKQARVFLDYNIKGLGFKEASHFLRNVGYSDVAIIDRHILRFMHQYGLIREIPKVITPKKYLECEAILEEFEIPQDKLDLILWYHMTGAVLK